MGLLSKFLGNKEHGSSDLNSLEIPPPPEFNSEIPQLKPEEQPALPMDQPPSGEASSSGAQPESAEPVPEPIKRPPIPDPEEEIAKRREEIMQSDEPLFAKIDDYKRIIDSSNDMKVRLQDCENILKRLNDIRLEADREHNKWKQELLDIYKKFSYVDKVISELEE